VAQYPAAERIADAVTRLQASRAKPALADYLIGQKLRGHSVNPLGVRLHFPDQAVGCSGAEQGHLLGPVTYQGILGSAPTPRLLDDTAVNKLSERLANRRRVKPCCRLCVAT